MKNGVLSHSAENVSPGECRVLLVERKQIQSPVLPLERVQEK